MVTEASRNCGGRAVRYAPFVLLLAALPAAAQTPAGGEFVIGSAAFPPFAARAPSIAADASGASVAIWVVPDAAFGYNVMGRRFDAAGAPLGSGFSVTGPVGDAVPGSSGAASRPTARRAAPRSW